MRTRALHMYVSNRNWTDARINACTNVHVCNRHCMLSTATGGPFVFIAVYISCHDSSRDVDDISSEVQTVTHMSAVTDELAVTRVTVRSRK